MNFGRLLCGNVLICIAWALPLLAATPNATEPAWGKEASGIRLGIQWGASTTDDTLIAGTLENLGPNSVAVPWQWGTGALSFDAVAPDGRTYELLDRVAFSPVEGLLTQKDEYLAPGSPLRFAVDLGRFVHAPIPNWPKELFALEYATPISETKYDITLCTLGDFLKDGFRVRAWFRSEPKYFAYLNATQSTFQVSSGFLVMPEARRAARRYWYQ